MPRGCKEAAMRQFAPWGGVICMCSQDLPPRICCCCYSLFCLCVWLCLCEYTEERGDDGSDEGGVVHAERRPLLLHGSGNSNTQTHPQKASLCVCGQKENTHDFEREKVVCWMCELAL